MRFSSETVMCQPSNHTPHRTCYCTGTSDEIFLQAQYSNNSRPPRPAPWCRQTELPVTTQEQHDGNVTLMMKGADCADTPCMRDDVTSAATQKKSLAYWRALHHFHEKLRPTFHSSKLLHNSLKALLSLVSCHLHVAIISQHAVLPSISHVSAFMDSIALWGSFLCFLLL